MKKKSYRTKNGHIKESAIREAQEIIQAAINDAKLFTVVFRPEGMIAYRSIYIQLEGDSLADIYINRLHELDGTPPPPF